MIEIDGSTKSGSGTIVRYSVGLAGLLSKDLHLFNIRQKRGKPGLRPQHLKAVQACAEMTRGKLEGDSVASNEIIFRPGEMIHGGSYQWDIGTAGSTTMLAQTILPLACFADAPSEIEITGGLFQDFAPAAHHLQHVVFPLYRRMGLDLSLEVIKLGYVPRSEGIIKLWVHPIKATKPLQLFEQGTVEKIDGIALSSHLEERKVSDRMAQTCNEFLNRENQSASIDCIYDTTSAQRGASLTIYAQTDQGCIFGSDLAGKLGRTSEKIGERVAKMLLKDLHSKATVDRHTADQLILYAALSNGETKYLIPKITEHVETNLWIVEKILGVQPKIENQKITISGIAFKK